ncbi:MAG TPA: GNAT family N-acetyltransferase [Clostridia bacterium]|nr:GNAT family N-acetyltransferase [Clostridia bacterium]
MFQIRKITPGDIDFIIGLTKESGIHEGRLLENIRDFVVCENNRALCGCGCLTVRGSEGYMNWVAVAGADRRSQLGSAIVKALLNIAEHRGVEVVYTPGICPDFLKALGFAETSSSRAIAGTMKVFGIAGACDIFEVYLEGYFKPCSPK